MTTETNQIPAQRENELLQCLQGNDQRHFSKLYDTYSPALFGVIVNWIKCNEVAENLLQDVFVKAWRNRARYDSSKGRIFTWLYNIAHHTYIDYLRSKAHKQGLVTMTGKNVHQILLSENINSFLPDTMGLRKLVYALRKEEKEMIELMYFQGFTQKEIAKIMKMPLGTVKTRINSAIRNLRYFFKKDWKRALQNISLN